MIGAVLVGMNNPHSDDPRLDLAPFPTGSAGHRLWSTIREFYPIGRAQYLRDFPRRNLLRARRWSRRAALAAVPELLAAVGNRGMIALGAEVRDLTGISGDLPAATWDRGSAWLPHPSGRCLWYNETGNRLLAARFLVATISESAAELGIVYNEVTENLL